jgi:hypothetical protein
MWWNRQAFLDALPATIEAELQQEAGGDHDLYALHLTAKDGSMGNDAVTVTPLTPPARPVVDPASDEDRNRRGVRNFQSDSRGGCNTTNMAVSQVYAVATTILRQQGYFVVDHHDDIF